MFRKKSRLDQVRDTVQDRASDLLDQASGAWNDQVAPALEDARKKAGPVIADARKKAQPVLDDAQKRFKDDVVPAVTSAVADARDKAQPYLDDARAEATRRGAATAAAVRGEVDAPKKGGRLKKILLAGGLLGIGAFVFSKLRGNDGADAWQSSYTPPAPPSPAPKPTAAPAANKPPAPAKKTASTDDAAGATPGEAASDEVAEDGPHAVSTPDDPATQVDVSGEPDPKP